EAGAAMLNRPAVGAPAARVQDAGPGDDVLAGFALAGEQADADVGGQLRGDELAQLVGEGALGGAVERFHRQPRRRCDSGRRQGRLAHRPVRRAGRFSMKSPTRSRKSSLRTLAAISRLASMVASASDWNGTSQSWRLITRIERWETLWAR